MKTTHQHPLFFGSVSICEESILSRDDVLRFSKQTRLQIPDKEKRQEEAFYKTGDQVWRGPSLVSMPEKDPVTKPAKISGGRRERQRFAAAKRRANADALSRFSQGLFEAGCCRQR